MRVTRSDQQSGILAPGNSNHTVGPIMFFQVVRQSFQNLSNILFLQVGLVTPKKNGCRSNHRQVGIETQIHSNTSLRQDFCTTTRDHDIDHRPATSGWQTSSPDWRWSDLPGLKSTVGSDEQDFYLPRYALGRARDRLHMRFQTGQSGYPSFDRSNDVFWIGLCDNRYNCCSTRQRVCSLKCPPASEIQSPTVSNVVGESSTEMVMPGYFESGPYPSRLIVDDVSLLS